MLIGLASLGQIGLKSKQALGIGGNVESSENTAPDEPPDEPSSGHPMSPPMSRPQHKRKVKGETPMSPPRSPPDEPPDEPPMSPKTRKINEKCIVFSALQCTQGPKYQAK